MMVCGSIVSSDALAGAASASKRVPVTTTVSSALVSDVFSASCCAAAGIAPTVRAWAAVDIRRRFAAVMENPLFKICAGRVATSVGRLAVLRIRPGAERLGKAPSSRQGVSRPFDGPVTAAIRKINLAGAGTPENSLWRAIPSPAVANPPSGRESLAARKYRQNKKKKKQQKKQDQHQKKKKNHTKTKTQKTKTKQTHAWAPPQGRWPGDAG